MGRCSLCDREMLTAGGCVEHKIILTDGRVIDAPRHDVDGSLDDEQPSDRCHDCGAEPDGIHHQWCDWARTPDGDQILKQSMAHFVPGETYAFVIVEHDTERDRTRNLTAFIDHEAALTFIEDDQRNLHIDSVPLDGGNDAES